MTIFPSLTRFGRSHGGGGSPPAGASYAYRGMAQTTASGGNVSASIDLGSHAGSFLVVVAAFGPALPTTLTVAGSSLATTEVSGTNVSGTGYSLIIKSGIFSSAQGGVQSVAVTESGNYNNRGFAVWTLDNLTNNSARASAVGAGNTPGQSISLAAGDILLAISPQFGSPDFSHSSVAPSGQHGVNPQCVAADWLIATSNTSFSIATSSFGNMALIAASYR